MTNHVVAITRTRLGPDYNEINRAVREALSLL